jgi:predicted DNA-binding protein
MTVAPLIAMKSTKCESLEAVGKELDRRAHTYANDVDQSGRHVGYLCRAGDESPVPLEQAIERRMGELNTKRKIRDNQVRAMGFIVSTNEALPDEETAKEFLDRSVQWFGARYGYENLLAAQIHLDEGTPHVHIWIAPVIHGEDGYDRLCAKELFAPDKRRKNAEGKWEVTAQGTMSRLQEDFWEQVAKPYGYERPMRHELRAKGYRSLDAYKVQVGTTRALKSEIETLEGERDMATAVTSMRIPTELNERYSRLAKETGRSRSFYVNEALQEAIDRFEYEYGILKDIEDYRAGRLETYSIDEVRAHCGLAN